MKRLPQVLAIVVGVLAFSADSAHAWAVKGYVLCDSNDNGVYDYHTGDDARLAGLELACANS